MDEEKAWLNFTNTGRVEDYLLYNKYKDKCVEVVREGMKNANKGEWIGNNGIEFGGT